MAPQGQSRPAKPKRGLQLPKEREKEKPLARSRHVDGNIF